jgi:hypothetical protein
MDAVQMQLALSRAPGPDRAATGGAGSRSKPTFHTQTASAALCARHPGGRDWSVRSTLHWPETARARSTRPILVENADGIVHELGFVSTKQNVTKRAGHRLAAAANAARLDKGDKILLDALRFEPASLDILVARTGLPSQFVASMLLFLELEDVVGLHSGGRYLRL